MATKDNINLIPEITACEVICISDEELLAQHAQTAAHHQVGELQALAALQHQRPLTEKRAMGHACIDDLGLEDLDLVVVQVVLDRHQAAHLSLQLGLTQRAFSVPVPVHEEVCIESSDLLIHRDVFRDLASGRPAVSFLVEGALWIKVCSCKERGRSCSSHRPSSVWSTLT